MELILLSGNSAHTKEYIHNQINSSKCILKKHSSKEKSFLLRLIKKVEQFTTKFPEEYL